MRLGHGVRCEVMKSGFREVGHEVRCGVMESGFREVGS